MRHLITILHQRGLHLPEHGLWLDPHRAKPLAFVSHAHSDHIARHRDVLMTAATARFMRERLGGTPSSGHFRSLFHLTRVILVVLLHRVRRPVMQRGVQ